MPANILTMQQEVVDEVMQEAGESEDELQMDACLDDVDGIPLTAREKNPLDPSNFDTLVCQSESPARLTTNSPEMPSASSSRPEQSLDDMIAEIECLVGSVCVTFPLHCMLRSLFVGLPMLLQAEVGREARERKESKASHSS